MPVLPGSLLWWVVRFMVVFVTMTVLSDIVWAAFVAGVLYNCTDPLFGYLTPDGFVHEYAGMSVRVVKQINPADPMSAGDSIKEGWTVGRLWCLWCAFLGTSVIVSVALASLSWRRRAV